MLYGSCQGKKVREGPFQNFNSLISRDEFKASDRQIKKIIIASFITDLTIRELRRSLNDNLSHTLNRSIKNNLVEALKRV